MTDQSEKQLISKLKSKDLGIRLRALKALRDLNPQHPDLLRFYTRVLLRRAEITPEYEEQFFFLVCSSLKKLGNIELDSGITAEYALLSSLKSKRRLSLLQKLSKQKSEEDIQGIRMIVIETLADIGGGPSEFSLKDVVRQDPDQLVREAARSALEVIDRRQAYIRQHGDEQTFFSEIRPEDVDLQLPIIEADDEPTTILHKPPAPSGGTGQIVTQSYQAMTYESDEAENVAMDFNMDDYLVKEPENPEEMLYHRDPIDLVEDGDGHISGQTEPPFAVPKRDIDNPDSPDRDIIPVFDADQGHSEHDREEPVSDITLELSDEHPVQEPEFTTDWSEQHDLEASPEEQAPPREADIERMFSPTVFLEQEPDLSQHIPGHDVMATASRQAEKVTGNDEETHAAETNQEWEPIDDPDHDTVARGSSGDHTEDYHEEEISLDELETVDGDVDEIVLPSLDSSLDMDALIEQGVLDASTEIDVPIEFDGAATDDSSKDSESSEPLEYIGQQSADVPTEIDLAITDDSLKDVDLSKLREHLDDFDDLGSSRTTSSHPDDRASSMTTIIEPPIERDFPVKLSDSDKELFFGGGKTAKKKGRSPAKKADTSSDNKAKVIVSSPTTLESVEDIAPGDQVFEDLMKEIEEEEERKTEVKDQKDQYKQVEQDVPRTGGHDTIEKARAEEVPVTTISSSDSPEGDVEFDWENDEIDGIADVPAGADSTAATSGPSGETGGTDILDAGPEEVLFDISGEGSSSNQGNAAESDEKILEVLHRDDFDRDLDDFLKEEKKVSQSLSDMDESASPHSRIALDNVKEASPSETMDIEHELDSSDLDVVFLEEKTRTPDELIDIDVDDETPEPERNSGGAETVQEFDGRNADESDEFSIELDDSSHVSTSTPSRTEKQGTTFHSGDDAISEMDDRGDPMSSSVDRDNDMEGGFDDFLVTSPESIDDRIHESAAEGTEDEEATAHEFDVDTDTGSIDEESAEHIMWNVASPYEGQTDEGVFRQKESDIHPVSDELEAGKTGVPTDSITGYQNDMHDDPASITISVEEDAEELIDLGGMEPEFHNKAPQKQNESVIDLDDDFLQSRYEPDDNTPSSDRNSHPLQNESAEDDSSAWSDTAKPSPSHVEKPGFSHPDDIEAIQIEDLRQKPNLAPGLGPLSDLDVSMDEGYLLSLIDGQTRIIDLARITGLGKDKTADIIAALIKRGFVSL